MLIELLLASAVATTEPVLVQPDERAAYQAMLDETARTADRLFQGECKDAALQTLSSTPVRIGDRPDFAAAHVQVKVVGCGHSAVENINVGRFGGSPPWRLVFGVPGDSNASYQLQQTSFPQISASVAAQAPADCHAGHLADVYVTAWPGHVVPAKPGEESSAKVAGKSVISLTPELEADKDKLNFDAAWSEYWPYEFCGQDRSVIVVFIPYREGGRSLFNLVPIWPIIAEHGPGARPAPAPRPADQTPVAGH